MFSLHLRNCKCMLGHKMLRVKCKFSTEFRTYLVSNYCRINSFKIIYTESNLRDYRVIKPRLFSLYIIVNLFGILLFMHNCKFLNQGLNQGKMC